MNAGAHLLVQIYRQQGRAPGRRPCVPVSCGGAPGKQSHFARRVQGHPRPAGVRTLSSAEFSSFPSQGRPRYRCRVHGRRGLCRAHSQGTKARGSVRRAIVCAPTPWVDFALTRFHFDSDPADLGAQRRRLAEAPRRRRHHLQSSLGGCWRELQRYARNPPAPLRPTDRVKTTTSS